MMNRSLPRFLLFAVFLPAALSAQTTTPAGTVTLSPAADATLIQNGSGARANGSGPALFVGRNSQGNRLRGLLRFDPGAQVPAGAVVLSARLELFLTPSNPAPAAVELHRVSASWGEGPSSSSGGGGAPSQAGDATWLHRFYDDVLWATPGGDFDAASGSSTVVGADGDYVWTGPELAADVQAWIDAPDANHGWILIGNEDAVQTAKRFASREGDAATAPRLIVEYAPPCEPAPLSQGYWHRQCLGVADGIRPGNGAGPRSATEPAFDALAECAADALEAAGLPGRSTCDALDASPPADPCERAEKQLAALVLNLCSGRLSPICGIEADETGCDATTVGELVDELVERIHAGDCRRAAACAGTVNEGDAIDGP